MIPAAHITAWAHFAPWADMGQIEQDLIISRAIIDIFSDEFLREELRFRGGTALNKLHFPEALRYSEDIDLVRTTHGPIGGILDRLREVLGGSVMPHSYKARLPLNSSIKLTPSTLGHVLG